MTIAKPRGRAVNAPASRGYHHEELRRALLDAALNHLRSGDVTGLTMQMLARAAGVSAGAPYHHFDDKVSVVAALAEEGFALWVERAQAILGDVMSPLNRLKAFAAAWLRFSVAHPSHYRVMFLPDVADRKRFSSLHETSGRALEQLLQILAAVSPEAATEKNQALAVAVWSTLHGFASLRINGVLANIPGLAAVAVLEETVLAAVCVMVR